MSKNLTSPHRSETRAPELDRNFADAARGSKASFVRASSSKARFPAYRLLTRAAQKEVSGPRPRGSGAREFTRLLQTAAIFAALGEETRLSLLNRLSAEGPLSITCLTEGAGVTRQAISRHLDVLRSAGLAVSRRQGRERVWAMQPSKLQTARRSLEEISAQWDAALERLRKMVERKGRCPAPPYSKGTFPSGGADATRFARVAQEET